MATVPDDARLKHLAGIHDTLAGFFDRMISVDPESEHSAQRNRDIAGVCRAVIAARALLPMLAEKVDHLASCEDRRERGEACGVRDTAKAFAAILADAPGDRARRG